MLFGVYQFDAEVGRRGRQRHHGSLRPFASALPSAQCPERCVCSFRNAKPCRLPRSEAVQPRHCAKGRLSLAHRSCTDGSRGQSTRAPAWVAAAPNGLDRTYVHMHPRGQMGLPKRVRHLSINSYHRSEKSTVAQGLWRCLGGARLPMIQALCRRHRLRGTSADVQGQDFGLRNVPIDAIMKNTGAQKAHTDAKRNTRICCAAPRRSSPVASQQPGRV